MSATTNEKILNALNMYNKGLQTKLDGKFVQQVAGKDLSTNDFTDADKAKLDSLSSAGSVDLDTLTDTFVQKVTGKDLSTNDFTDAYKSTIDGLSGTYVQQVSGKNLSTNDFTDAYKSTIDGLSGTYVQQVSGKNLSTNDFTDAYKTAIDGLSGTYVQQVSGKDLSTNDFTDAYKTAIDGLSGTYVQQISGKDLSTNDFTDAYKSTIDGLSGTYVQQISGKDLSTNDFTDAYKTAIDGLSGTYAMKTDITKVYKLKGSVANFAALPTNADEGDVYNILAAGGTDENGIEIKAGDNVVKTATGWDVIGGTVDLTNYVQKVTGKDLSTNDFTDAYKSTIDGLSGVYVQQVTGKDLSTNDFTDAYKSTIDGLSGVYVQQVTGKDLSTNDFTDADKAKLDSLSSGGSIDLDTLTDTFVTKVTGKDLSTNDFTDADKTKLDGLPAVSVFMKALLEANDAVEARKILQVGRSGIFDEAGNVWQLMQGAYLSTTQKKFGSKSMYFSGTNSYMWLPHCITLGGSDFSMGGWFYSADAATSYQGLFSFGLSSSMIQVMRNGSNKVYWAATGTTSFNNNVASTTTFDLNRWNYVEVCYKYSTNTLYLFFNGQLFNSQTATWFQTARSYPVYVGVTVYKFSYLYNGYADEFFITNKCLHTSAYTSALPSAARSLDSDTLALLHFED